MHNTYIAPRLERPSAPCRAHSGARAQPGRRFPAAPARTPRHRGLLPSPPCPRRVSPSRLPAKPRRQNPAAAAPTAPRAIRPQLPPSPHSESSAHGRGRRRAGHGTKEPRQPLGACSPPGPSPTLTHRPHARPARRQHSLNSRTRRPPGSARAGEREQAQARPAPSAAAPPPSQRRAGAVREPGSSGGGSGRCAGKAGVSQRAELF